jgi:hypothetical protein
LYHFISIEEGMGGRSFTEFWATSDELSIFDGDVRNMYIYHEKGFGNLLLVIGITRIRLGSTMLS